MFPPHFFKRYAERFNLDLHGKDLIVHFFSDNIFFPLKVMEDKVGKPYLAGCFADGVGLGEITKEGNYIFKTFITYDLAKGNQIEEFKNLDFIRKVKLHRKMTNNNRPYVKATNITDVSTLFDFGEQPKENTQGIADMLIKAKLTNLNDNKK